MTTEVVTSIPTGDSIQPMRALYTRVVVFYNNKELFREDLFGVNIMTQAELLYERIIKQHSRDIKLNQLGI